MSPVQRESPVRPCSPCARSTRSPHSVRDCTLTELYRADEAFCTGTMGELVPVGAVDGRPIGAGERPMLERLMALFKELTQSSGDPVVASRSDA